MLTVTPEVGCHLVVLRRLRNVLRDGIAEGLNKIGFSFASIGFKLA